VGGGGGGTGDIELRFVIAGGDLLLHQFLSAYLFCIQSNPQLLTGLKCKFCVVPWQSNGVSAFLARHDSWYNRHVYVPFRSQAFLVPWVSVDKVEESDRSLELPGQFLRSLVDSYVREAAVTCNFNVYKVQAWVRAPESKGGVPDTTPCDQLIPFIQRVELGVDAAVHLFRQTVEKGKAERKLEDVMKDRAFTWQTPPELNVRFTQMDLAGNKLAQIIDDGAVYDSILLANVPRKSDPCFPADPLSPWLEMFARPHRTYTRAPTKKNFLLGDPKQHVHAADVSSVTSSGSFHILVDGQRFGPYNRIRISPVLEEGTGRAFTFPIQTFFPLDI